MRISLRPVAALKLTEGRNQKAKLKRLETLSVALPGTFTYWLMPLNWRALPNLPVTRAGLLTSVPTLLLAESSAVVPEASSNFHQLIPGVVMGGGGSCTVSRKELDALRIPSLTKTVIVAKPVWLVAGVTRTVRLEAPPPKAMFAAGASVGFEELAVSVRPAAG